MKMSYIVFGTLLIFVISCRNINSNDELDPALERDEILRLHNLQRDFHFQKRVEEFASLLSESHISVNRGEIKHPAREENIDRFGNYFDNVDFVKWDDLQPPIIRFSDDYSLAYTTVNKEVIVKYQDEMNNEVRDSTEYSWVAIYKKYSDGWKIDCVASTNK